MEREDDPAGEPPVEGVPAALRPYVGHLLARAGARANACAMATFPPDFHVSGLPILNTLAAGPASQRELSELLSVNRTVMVQLVDRLEAAGLVVRRRDPRDRRSYALGLTDGGKERLVELNALGDRTEDCTAAHLGPGQRARLLELLRELLRAHGAPDYPDRVARRVGFLLVRAHFWFRDVGREQLAPLGIDPRHFGALVVLDDLGPCPQARLAEELGVSGTIVVQLADRLEEAGFVARRRAPQDRRVHLLTVTPAGEDALAKARPAMDEAHAAVSAGLGAAGAAELHALLLALLGVDDR